MPDRARRRLARTRKSASRPAGPAKTGQARVLIAHDQAIFRRGVRTVLEAADGVRVVGEAANGREAVRLACQLKPDIVLLGLPMPDQKGLDKLHELSVADPPVRTIVISAVVEKPQIMEAFRIGACGIVPKNAAPELLAKSIRSVMAGQYWLSHHSVSALVKCLRDLIPATRQPGPEESNALTRRQLEVVAAVLAGSTNTEIAQKFALSRETVKHHLTSIFDKLGVSNRLELALFAIHHHLAGHE